MFILRVRLFKTPRVPLSTKSIYSFGIYWRKLLALVLWYDNLLIREVYNRADLFRLKYYLLEIFNNQDMGSEYSIAQIQRKKEIQSYQGLRLHLHLPVHGQWTRTNASTQRMLAKMPRKRHFLQRKNWWKFAPQNIKKNFNRPKVEHDNKKK